MSTMRISSDFRSLNTNALKSGKVLSASKASLLAGNTGWLYEAFMNQPVDGNQSLSCRSSFDHTGNGTGKHVPVVMNHMRGLLRSGNNFDEPLRIIGSGSVSNATFVCSHMTTGNINTNITGYNWSRFDNVPFWPHTYARILRTRIKARLYSGSATALIWPVIFEDEFNTAIILKGDQVNISSSSYETIDIDINLEKAVLERSNIPDSHWFWGLQVWVPSGSVVDLYDDDYTGPCLAVCSV